MKAASEEKRSELKAELKGKPLSGEPTVSQLLHKVADTFVQAQQKRNEADYENAKEWTRTEVLEQIGAVSDAFKSWNIIRDESVAQAYLVSLLLGKKRRSE
ncbi:MAG: hypothetical protein M3Y24_05040 [Acidobacteriota bacterium]|nr:hypothetical protein [Acidobacteriota bacterium]